MAQWAFQTPIAYIVPPFLPDTEDTLAYQLFKFYPPLPRGVNVFQLQDGSYVQDFPTEENSNTNIPQPILLESNTVDSEGNTVYQPVAEAWGLPGENFAPNVTRTYVENPVIRIFYGGHNYVVDDETAAQLTNYGYTVTALE